VLLASGLLFATYELCHALIDDLELEELRRVQRHRQYRRKVSSLPRTNVIDEVV
ncbi:hypothetical protein FOZ63_030340, partial [Perkinsus olseni]